MEANLNDMFKFVKDDHSFNFGEAFECTLLHRVCMNLLKCAFRVKSTKFMEFMVSQRGIKENLKNLKAIKEIKLLTYHIEVHCLNEHLNASYHFLSKVIDNYFVFRS